MAKKKAKPDFSKPKNTREIQELLENTEERVNGAAKKQYEGLPLLVIAGRPNVGKSTLFNRFMQRRLAIVDPTPGVTRDPVEGTAMINGKPVHIVDTGGYKLQRDEGTMEAVLDELVVERSLEMIEKADVILLLLEAGQITGEDEEFIIQLRPHWNKVIAAVNKTEGGKNESVSWNYAQFGFKNLFFISAEHGDNISDLSKCLVSKLDFSNVREITEEEIPIRIALMGKPNTGKSTLSNRLTHSNASIVSDYAGTTRDTVEGGFSYGGKNFIVLDTAGIRRKARVHENVEYYSVNRAIKTLDRCDIVFLMIDAQEGLSEQDKKICSLAFERGRGIIFILNKWDTQEQDRKTFRKTREWINIMFGQMEYAPILPLSALNGTGIKDLLNEAIEIYKQLNHKVETAALNMALKDWLFKYPPPASKTAHFKIRYMTQKSTNPVNFLIFATRPEVVPETYITFLKNRIREDLGFDKIPVQLEMKASRQKWEDRFDS
ncbi:MAG: ribosome biogenesis GTPase Der [Treponema porcinum]|uniref:ribosome biogenesis GTPase Der n=1 Tax=Treponema porcinum TaxID=261392 RepID=UPI002357E86F|nr:ribosome biogenesis GTPase Der [Treponema porcinum]MCI6180424.1 ribosome biogenesis GTPase Der [Treponema porcinum]MCI7545679.1 ribosome biogenesis GTPase Der [Treponema porcinum]